MYRIIENNKLFALLKIKVVNQESRIINTIKYNKEFFYISLLGADWLQYNVPTYASVSMFIYMRK